MKEREVRGEGRERKGILIDTKEFYRKILQLPSKWESVQHSKKNALSNALEPLPDARNFWECIFFHSWSQTVNGTIKPNLVIYMTHLAFFDHLYWFNQQRVFPSTETHINSSEGGRETLAMKKQMKRQRFGGDMDSCSWSHTDLM